MIKYKQIRKIHETKPSNGKQIIGITKKPLIQWFKFYIAYLARHLSGYSHNRAQTLFDKVINTPSRDKLNDLNIFICNYISNASLPDCIT